MNAIDCERLDLQESLFFEVARKKTSVRKRFKRTKGSPCTKPDANSLRDAASPPGRVLRPRRAKSVAKCFRLEHRQR
jgi:hypothetical protein